MNHMCDKDYPWLEIINQDIKLGNIRHALFDFDGTISVIRQGWENVMIPLMVEMICDGNPPDPELIKEVEEYVDRSTGILTIYQMKWLEDAVRRHGLSRHPETAKAYKKIYSERLLKPVRERLAKLGQGETSIDDLMIMGARAFVASLFEHGVTLYLASGTDHEYVMEEASALQITEYFGPRIYGALDDTEEHTKERIIQRILDEYGLSGESLLVVGDGPVEIRNAKERGAIALGVASDEVKRHGLNPRKRQRLLEAGADLMISDFSHHKELVDLLTGSH